MRSAISDDLKTLITSVLASNEWNSGQVSAEAVLALVRLSRASGHVLDDETTRSAMSMVGIDPGPVWDRPLNSHPNRLPIRPAAFMRYETLLADFRPVLIGLERR